MNIHPLSTDAFRQKVLGCYQNYLAVSPKSTISIGILCGEDGYVLGDLQEEQAKLYNIGSISKTLTAHLILRLAQDGKLDLNRPIDDYLPLKSGVYPTATELLTHTAGFGHITPLEITAPGFLLHRYAFQNPYEKCTEKQILKALERRRRRRKTAHKYGYSDFSFAVLALLAQRVSGVPFATLLQDFLHTELGLSGTGISCKDREPPAAVGKKAVPFWHWRAENPYLGAGGLLSNIFDMLHYLELEIFSPAPFITAAHTVCESAFSPKSKLGVCVGWHTYRRSDQLWHVGAVGTFHSSLIFNRKRKIAVAVLGNVKGKRAANVHYLAKMLYYELKTNKINLSSKRSTL